MHPIGGYFEFEINTKKWFPHSDGTLLNSGMFALKYILQSLSKPPQMVWVPYYTCDVVIRPLRELGIPFKFYNVSEKLEIAEPLNISVNDYIIVNNYFGVKDNYIKSIAQRYGDRLIIDCAQSFFTQQIDGCRILYSPRKFFGVPDGGIAYTPDKNGLHLTVSTSYDLCSHLLKRIDVNPSFGYQDFKRNSELLNNGSLQYMSNLTRYLLSSIDYDKVRKQRIENFVILHKALNNSNKLDLPAIDTFACPMVYPYRTKDVALRKRLLQSNVYVATYWPNVKQWCSPKDLDYALTDEIIPLPIDQRYGKKEMDYLIEIINSSLASSLVGT